MKNEEEPNKLPVEGREEDLFELPTKGRDEDNPPTPVFLE